MHIKQKAVLGMQGGEHGFGSFLLALHLRVAVGALQETGISMTGQLCHGLLVYAAVQQSGDEEVTQGVQMVFGVESISGVNLPQALGECIGMDERAVCVCKQIGTERHTVPGGPLL